MFQSKFGISTNEGEKNVYFKHCRFLLRFLFNKLFFFFQIWIFIGEKKRLIHLVTKSHTKFQREDLYKAASLVSPCRFFSTLEIRQNVTQWT